MAKKNISGFAYIRRGYWRNLTHLAASLLQSNKYDIIILGAGCAGLSLLMRILRHDKLNQAKILLIDKELKNRNDRTWCFWEKQPGFFEEIVHHKWNQLVFETIDYRKQLDIAPYTYKMIRGIDFYEHCFAEIRKFPNVEMVSASIDDWKHADQHTTLTIKGKVYELENRHLFNSLYRPNTNKKFTRLLQHFKGWIIELDQDYFDPYEAVLMDFRVSQQHGTSFAYALPINKRKALVEYTLFTKELLQPHQYDEELRRYLHEILFITEYKITETEFGIIPMTDEQFATSSVLKLIAPLYSPTNT